MKRDRWIQLGATLILISCIGASGALLPRITAESSEAQLRYTDEATRGAPLPVVIAQSVGVLRGIVVNYLWIRADKLKSDGKFFEAYTLADWITKLQPRFSKVWAFQAWNMAYNISVATHTRDERWKWVQDGIRLIREQGLKYNPNDMWLYKELSWYFLHKIGGFTDDAHQYYKDQLAYEWHSILGEPPYEFESRIAAIRTIADAPAAVEDLASQNPQAASLIAELQDAGFRLDIRFLEAAARLDAVGGSFSAEKAGLSEVLDEFENTPPEEIDPRIRSEVLSLLALRQISAGENATALPDLLATVRHQVLREDYNMDPALMAQAMEKFGPLDWRSPFAHSLYWAWVGVERGLTRLNEYQFDRINTDRLLFHSEQFLTRQGRVFFDYLSRRSSYGPDLRFIPYYESTFTVVWSRESADKERPSQTFQDGYRNFLIDVVRQYYQWGEYDKADETYARLRTDPQFFEPDKPDRFTLPIQEFILAETKERWTSPQVARGDVLGMLVSAFRFGAARGDRDAYRSAYNNAKILYDYFMTEFADYQTLFSEANRLEMPPWPQMVALAFQFAMTDSVVTMEERIRMWEIAADDVKLTSYDLILTQLQDSFAQSPLAGRVEFDQVFPPPPGLAQYRMEQGITPPEDTNKNNLLNIERK